MSVLKTLARIRPAFLQRAINRMARGAGVRADFQEQLDQFYDLLIQAVETGYPTWLDSILYNWAASLKRMAGRSGSNQKGTTRNAVPALHFMSCFRSEQSRRIPKLPGFLALKSIRKKING